MNIFKHTFMYHMFASIHSVSAMSKGYQLSISSALIDQQLCGHGCSPESGEKIYSHPSIPTCYKMKVGVVDYLVLFLSTPPSCITGRIPTSQSFCKKNLPFNNPKPTKNATWEVPTILTSTTSFLWMCKGRSRQP